ncbi:uncharacterized protein FSUBG_8759 [Fusarium subglutinans]|uniref:Uncharacterized protein n=1 Tax=Gibberella subglutinans TaxID=42677 RepID=A0A8H5PHU8_GIBSU|nr:uncharacterized protein FSUBG_8759 [Fusarium subglutinans]KAF5596804.1 hypothetical protein FSUBG_8759 [Fusarium subglutinans]
MEPLKREMCYELLVKTPGLSFPDPSTTEAAEFSKSCKTVFGGPAPRPHMNKAEAEDKICEFLTECENHFHRLTMCPIHNISARPCECPEKSAKYYYHIAIEATLCARIEVIKKNGGIQNDINGANNLILLNVHILLCNFASFKHTHSYAPVQTLCWTVNGALESQQEATKRKKTLLKQREVKKLKSASGAGSLPATDAAVAKERIKILSFLAFPWPALRGLDFFNEPKIVWTWLVSMEKRKELAQFGVGDFDV